MDLEYAADPGDFDTPVAFPSAAAGWTVERRSEFDNKGEETVVLTSHREFAPREALPSNFAPPGDKDEALYLQFPTTVRVEQRPDGTYMHFRRVYAPRKWAYIQYWREQFFGDDIDELGDKALDELTIEEKARVLKAFAGFELFKHIELAGIAIDKLGDRIPQDAGLKATMALTREYQDVDWQAFVERFEPPPADHEATEEANATDDGRDADEPADRGAERSPEDADQDRRKREGRFEAEARRLLIESLHRAMSELKASAGLSESEMRLLHREFSRAKKEYSITEALGAHSFKIKVILPGELVGHNGDKFDEDEGEVVWEFDGNAFRDRRFELAATAKLAGGPHGR